MNDNTMGVIGVVFVIVCIFAGFLMYFLPSIVASKCNHPNVVAIRVLNFFLGWTLLGWVGALVWACTGVDGNGQSKEHYRYVPSEPYTSYRQDDWAGSRRLVPLNRIEEK